MKKILVTGGTGFIGSHTAVELAAAGFEPVLVDDFSNSEERILNGMKQITGQPFRFHRVDCTDKPEFAKVFMVEKPDAVIHFAAFKSVNESVENPLKYYRNNILSLLVLLELMKENEVNQLVFSSSCTVYGQPDVNPVTESSPVRQAASPYGYSKQVSEQLISDYHGSANHFSSVLLRYFNPVGAHPSGHIGELPYGVPNNLVPFITQTAAGLRSELTIFGNDYSTADGTCIRDFIHVVDLARAHVKALQWLDQNAGKCEVFNVGQGKGHSVLDAVKTFVSVTGVQLNYIIGPRRQGDIEQVWADVAKANRELHWQAEYTLEDAMRDAWNWQQKLAAYA